MVRFPSSTGVRGSGMIQDGDYVNLGEPLFSRGNSEYVNSSSKMQVLAEEVMVVGLIDSTLSMGKPCTWGSDQQCGGKLSTLV